MIIVLKVKAFDKENLSLFAVAQLIGHKTTNKSLGIKSLYIKSTKLSNMDYALHLKTCSEILFICLSLCSIIICANHINTDIFLFPLVIKHIDVINVSQVTFLVLLFNNHQ
jgi:hypothetical protein